MGEEKKNTEENTGDSDKNDGSLRGNGDLVSHKISITTEAEKTVSKLVLRINDGFEGGRVSRQDVASWFLLRSAEKFGDDELQQIRSEFFNERDYLSTVLKKAKGSHDLPKELRTLLRSSSGVSAEKRKAKKRLIPDYTNEVINSVESDEAAT